MSNPPAPSHGSRQERGSALTKAHIAITTTSTIAEPLKFLQEQLTPESLVVVEMSDQVRVLHLNDVVWNEKTLQAHGFCPSKKSQARVARAGDTWLADAVRECDDTQTNAQPVYAQARVHMCLGTKVAASNQGTTMAEARIKPYILPVSPSASGQHDISYLNYFQQTKTGRLACVAHRVIGIIDREAKK